MSARKLLDYGFANYTIYNPNIYIKLNNKIKIIAVIGPTASGKTGLAVEIAKKFGGEVVSADSMQIYSELTIGTAKPTEKEMQGVPHHLVGHKSIDDEYSVVDYVDEAKKIIEEKNNENEEKMKKEIIEMAKKEMKIEGMMCGHCEARVKKCLEALEQVVEAVVSHETGTAVVTLIGDISDDELKAVVEAQDYKVIDIQ